MITFRYEEVAQLVQDHRANMWQKQVLFIYLATLCGMQGLSSPIRDQTCVKHTVLTSGPRRSSLETGFKPTRFDLRSFSLNQG